MKVKVEGTKQAVRQISEMVYQDRRMVSAAVREGLALILKLAKFYCPKDTRALVNSGKVVMERNAMTGEVKFGDSEAYYAIWVHEDLTKHHDSPTCAKFLERAMRELEGSNARLIQAALKKAMRRN